jgi:hypothetical protein
MAKKKILKQNGQDVFPITNDSCVLDNNGVSLNAKIGNLSDLNTDNKSNLVSAINDIAALNTTTKQHLVNTLLQQGVSGSINESWNSLINKISTLADSESKGVRFATGSGNWNAYCNSSKVVELTIPTNLDFNPTMVICNISYAPLYLDYSVNDSFINVFVSNTTPLKHDIFTDGHEAIKITNFSADSFTLTTKAWKTQYGSSQVDVYIPSLEVVEWVAIGVGENITSGGLDIISATELPATGKENQLCAITNKPHTAIYITPDPTCVFEDDSITFLISDDYRTSRGSVCVTNDNMYCFYYFDRAVQNSSGLDVYKCINGAWELFLKKIVTVYDFGKSELGISTGGNQVINTNNNIVQLYITNAYYVSLCFTTLIDFSKYSTCEITFTGGDSSSGRKHNIYIMNSASPTSSIQSALTSFNYAEITSANSISLAGVSEATPLTVTIDISSLKGSGYFGLIDYFNPLTYTTTNISKITIY